MEPAHPLNQVCHVPESGLVLMAVEDPKMQAYYIPVSQLLAGISGLTGGGRMAGGKWSMDEWGRWVVRSVN